MFVFVFPLDLVQGRWRGHCKNAHLVFCGSSASGSCLLASYATRSEALTLGQALWGQQGCGQKSAAVPGLSASVSGETGHAHTGMMQSNSCLDGRELGDN